MSPSQLPVSILDIVVVVILFAACIVMGWVSLSEDYATQTIWCLGLVTIANTALLIVTRWPVQIRDRLSACLVDLCGRGTFGFILFASLLSSLRAVLSKMNPNYGFFPGQYGYDDSNVGPIMGVMFLFLIALVGNMLILFQFHNSDNQSIAKWYLWITSAVAAMMSETLASFLVFVWV